MEAAKLAVANFTSKTGHFTEVDEHVAPAVITEVIKPTRHEVLTTAIDREVHQHHYHTTIQPITHTETLPTKHVHNLIPIEHREIREEDEEKSKAFVASELARFRNSTIVEPTRLSKAAVGEVVGEHVHHHVHEVVQPVIYKETIQRETVHTVVPVHETHHSAATIDGISQLPIKPLAEFTKLGGTLTGTQSAIREQYEGPPRAYRHDLETTMEKLGFVGHGSNTVGKHHSHHTISTPPQSPVNRHSSPMSTSSVTTGPSAPTTPKNHEFVDNAPIRSSLDSVNSVNATGNTKHVGRKSSNGSFLGKIISHHRRSGSQSEAY